MCVCLFLPLKLNVLHVCHLRPFFFFFQHQPQSFVITPRRDYTSLRRAELSSVSMLVMFGSQQEAEILQGPTSRVSEVWNSPRRQRSSNYCTLSRVFFYGQRGSDTGRQSCLKDIKGVSVPVSSRVHCLVDENTNTDICRAYSSVCQGAGSHYWLFWGVLGGLLKRLYFICFLKAQELCWQCSAIDWSQQMSSI